jgi:hypothetical protein
MKKEIICEFLFSITKLSYKFLRKNEDIIISIMTLLSGSIICFFYFFEQNALFDLFVFLTCGGMSVLIYSLIINILKFALRFYEDNNEDKIKSKDKEKELKPLKRSYYNLIEPTLKDIRNFIIVFFLFILAFFFFFGMIILYLIYANFIVSSIFLRKVFSDNLALHIIIKLIILYLAYNFSYICIENIFITLSKKFSNYFLIKLYKYAIITQKCIPYIASLIFFVSIPILIKESSANPHKSALSFLNIIIILITTIPFIIYIIFKVIKHIRDPNKLTRGKRDFFKKIKYMRLKIIWLLLAYILF